MNGLRRILLLRLGAPRSLSSCNKVTLNKYNTSETCQHAKLRRYHISAAMFDIKAIETPTFPDSVSEGDIQWLKEVGDTVEEDEVIGEIETDKTTLPVQSPVAGVITQLLVSNGDTIAKGTLLANVEVGGAAPAPSSPTPSSPEPVTPEPAAPEPATPSESINIKVPTFPDSVSEGDLTWLKEVGDTVEADEVIGEIETDKTALPVQAPCAGTITQFLVESGTTVGKNVDVAVISSGGSSAPATPAAPSPVVAPVATPVPPTSVGPVPTSPGIPPPIPSAPLSVTPPPLPKAAPSPIITEGELKPPGMRTESKVKMSRMRQRISQRLKEAQNTAAMLTTFNEIDMTNIMALRGKFKDDFLKKHGVKLGFMSAFLKASAQGLSEMPEVNGYIDGNEIIYRDYVDISVAVATPKGLVVPVLRNVETMSYADIELGLSALGKKARDGDLAIEDMDGGTFTISNGGVFGSMFGTPIINLPQSAILGMHAIQERPVALNGNVVIRPMMYIALTYDHRLIDGREAVTFLKRIKSAVEDPAILLLDL